MEVAGDTDVHVGRWTGSHDVEDRCPCPQEACGLISAARALRVCPQHAWDADRPLRSGHWASDCPGAAA